MNTLRVLYRGSLTSCNYACNYCPFAKTKNTREELERDRQQLFRFADWVEAAERPIGIMITPWGEAIIHRYYRETMVRLSLLDTVQRVAIQTNLSGYFDDLESGCVRKIAIWATFHPGETSIDRFLERCDRLEQMGIRYSVGVVGFREHFADIGRLRSELPPHVYLWINAPKSSGIVYEQQELQFLESIDPHFHWNVQRWPSYGKPCRTGFDSIAIDGEGNVRRCHFVDEILGNIYSEPIWNRLERRACPNATCGCHIGYVNREDFELDQLYGANMLERIPASWPHSLHT